MDNIINIDWIKFFQEGMKRLYQIIYIIIFVTTFLYPKYKAHSQEVLEVSPKTITCGQKLTVKANMLNKEKAYSLNIECNDLACTNPPGFKPVKYEIPLGSVSYIKEQTFNINERCTSGLIKAPAGKFTIKLVDSQNKLVASDLFDIQGSTPTTCLISTDNTVESTEDAVFKVQGKQGCIYKISIINPTGIRQPVSDITITKSGSFSGIINKALINIPGKYTLTGIADTSCTELSVDERECSTSQIRVIDGNCTYSPQDKTFNCEQCSKNKVCANTGKCVEDTTGICTKEQIEKSEPIEETDVNTVKNSNTNILSRIKAANTSSLIGLTLGMVIFAFMVYKVLAYRFKRE